jgi:hypothetical protein
MKRVPSSETARLERRYRCQKVIPVVRKKAKICISVIMGQDFALARPAEEETRTDPVFVTQSG